MVTYRERGHQVWATMTAVLLIVALVLLFIRSYYSALGCDGGWYSYPALELAQRGTLGGNLCAPGDQIEQHGISAYFDFATHTSLRVFYTALGFKLLSSDILTIRLVSYAEWLALLTVMYFALAACVSKKSSLLLLWACFVNDKTILLQAAGDFRPDIAVATATLLAFVLFHRRRTIVNSIAMVAVSGAMALVHSTAAVSFCGILVYVTAHQLLTTRHLWSALRLPAAMAASFGLAVLVGNQLVFAPMLQTCTTASAGVDIGHRISTLWQSGFMPIVGKEAHRWVGYFFKTNVAVLMVLMLGAIAASNRRPVGDMRSIQGRALLVAVFSMLVTLLLLDPHSADTHAIPVAPFFYLLLATQAHRIVGARGMVRHSLAGIAVVAGLSSVALSAKLAKEGSASEYNVRSVSNLLNCITATPASRTTIIGPVEIFPFLDTDGDFLIIDSNRGGRDLDKLNSVVALASYVILSDKYDSDAWKRNFSQAMSAYRLEAIAAVGGSRENLTVFRLHRAENVRSQ